MDHVMTITCTLTFMPHTLTLLWPRGRLSCSSSENVGVLKNCLSVCNQARDWNIPDDESNAVNFLDVYTMIVKHALDPLEPFVLPEDKKNAPIRVKIGRSQNSSDFQDVPLSVKVSEAVALFGLYVKFFVLCEDLPCSSQSISVSGRNAVEVWT